eukprot:8894696-Pyramimonas_sp.AAC.1
MAWRSCAGKVAAASIAATSSSWAARSSPPSPGRSRSLACDPGASASPSERGWPRRARRRAGARSLVLREAER